MPESRQHYQDKIAAWAHKPAAPKTRWSDLELYFDDPVLYLTSEDWIHGFGDVW